MRKLLVMISLLSLPLASYAEANTVATESNTILIKTSFHDGEEWRSFQFCPEATRCRTIGNSSEYPVSWLKKSAHAHYVKIATASLKDVGLIGAALVAGYFTLGGIAIGGGALTSAGGAIVAGSATAASEPFINSLNPAEQYREAHSLENYAVQGNSVALKNNEEVQKVALCLDRALKQYRREI